MYAARAGSQRPMKVLIAGDWHSTVHEEPAAAALERLGCEVVRFPWHGYFDSTTAPASRTGRVTQLGARIQNRLLLGPRLSRMNKDLAERARAAEPDFILLYRASHVTPGCLQAIRAALPKTIIVTYNNDDPFAPGYSSWLWRHFKASVRLCDLVLSYRPGNLEDYVRAGARRVRLLRSWFVPEVHRPVELSAEERHAFECDVVFVGHYEPDGRLQMLDSIARAGFRVRLFGPGYDWDGPLLESEALRSLVPVRLVWGDDYVKALCGAKVALCFLSRLNRDSYTRRSFEIPATGTLMLSEYTPDLAKMFEEGSEVDFFRDEEELIRKVRHYVENDTRRRAVADAGRRRVRADAHDVESRMQALLDWVCEIRQERNADNAAECA
jgi:spore maturation protein CgeB